MTTMNRYGSLKPNLTPNHRRTSMSFHESVSGNVTQSEYEKMCDKVQAIAKDVAEKTLEEPKTIDIHEALKIDPKKEPKDDK